MDQITDYSTLEREPAGLPDRRPTRRAWKVAAAGVVVAAVLFAAFGYPGFFHRKEAKAAAPPAALPQVTVSRPAAARGRYRLGFLGQFSAIDRVELRAQVGGTLASINFADGQIVHKGDLLFTIDPRPYEVRLQQAVAQLQTTRRVA